MEDWMFFPGISHVNKEGDRRENFRQVQQALCAHYGHAWGIKSQVHGLPNGMHASKHFVSVSQNDKGALNISRLEEYLQQFLLHILLPADTFLHLTLMRHANHLL